ncbi:hypothetical protein O3P69_013159 [Scylla paramamosain]|uniref:Uncharacterized protein n=1 Tax=Scylla paramamosain TaxID=85552 RepID=A0AAW0TYV1_SCYPA
MLILLHTFWYLQHVTLLPFISSGACIPDILGWIGMLQAPVLLSPSAAAGRGSTWLDKYISSSVPQWSGLRVTCSGRREATSR